MFMYSYCLYALFCIFSFHRANWHSPTTLTEVFPCSFLRCKANARVYLAKTGHGPHSSYKWNVLYYVLLVSIVSFSLLFVCKCVLYYCHRVATQLQLNISYHISYHIIYRIVLYIISYCIVLYHIVSYRIVSYRIVSYRIVSYRIVSYYIIYQNFFNLTNFFLNFMWSLFRSCWSQNDPPFSIKFEVSLHHVQAQLNHEFCSHINPHFALAFIFSWQKSIRSSQIGNVSVCHVASKVALPWLYLWPYKI